MSEEEEVNWRSVVAPMLPGGSVIGGDENETEGVCRVVLAFKRCLLQKKR